jgi:hypothetical protein
VSPQRIQRKRVKGWRMPEGAIVVSRPSKWGNPWRIVVDGKWHKVRHATEDRIAGEFVIPEYARQTATRMFYSDLVNDRLPYSQDDVERELGGHDLCCWCPPTPLNPNGSLNWLGLQCHGEVLLEIANPVDDGRTT